MKREKKTVETNFFTLFIIVVIICIVAFAFGKISGSKDSNIKNNEDVKTTLYTSETEQQTEEKIYSNNVISLDIGKLSDSWKVVEKQNGSIIFYIQGPIKQNEDGTTDDIRINVYLEKSSMTND